MHLSVHLYTSSVLISGRTSQQNAEAGYSFLLFSLSSVTNRLGSRVSVIRRRFCLVAGGGRKDAIEDAGWFE
jgi:hypothetical protein